MTVETVADRLAMIHAQIDAVDRRWSHPVQIVAVTKGFEAPVVAQAVQAGCTSIGENYAQELLRKRPEIEAHRPEVHFIGRLQSNKVRQLVGLVDVWASLDRTSIVDAVAHRAPDARVLIQVNTTGEEGKGGCGPEEVAALVARARQAGLRVEGLMTVGPTAAEPEAARPGFRTVRHMVDDLGLEVCSMGMTMDLTVGVEEGATSVRVGTALFGPRPRRSPPEPPASPSPGMA